LTARANYETIWQIEIVRLNLTRSGVLRFGVMNSESHSCKRPAIANMDHVLFDAEDGSRREMVNRCCLHCGQHWAGEKGDVREYTRKEWDDLLNKAFDEDRIGALQPPSGS
jgi:hypothetical protein